MKKVDEWVKTCLRKKKLKESWANDIIKRSGGKLRKYNCPHCFSWHVTSKPHKNETANKKNSST